MSKTRTIEAHVELGIQQPFEVVSCRVEEGISATTRARIEVTSRDDLDLESVLTGNAEVSLLVDGFLARRWSLKISAAHFVTAKDHGLRFEVELASPEWILSLVKDTRKFRNQTARQIVSTILDRAGLKYAWQTVRQTPERNYTVQFRETNYDFVRRLLEFEGIYYTFDEDGVMILADQSSASPAVPGVSAFTLLQGTGALADGEEGIHEIRRGARVRSGKATVHDFDWKNPSTNLRKSRTADRDGNLEVYDYPVGYRDAGEGEYLAQIRLEALRVGARYVIGQSSVTRFAPAHVFTFLPSGSMNDESPFAGTYLPTQVVHSYRNPIFPPTPRPGGHPGARADQVAEDQVYGNTFTAIPREVPFRPAVVTPRPVLDGYHTAMVRGPAGEEIHTDKHGRFKAQFHWDREAKSTDEDSRWLRMVQESASSTFLARVGWEVNVAYIDGDPERPIGLARNINRVMPPAYSQPAKKTVMTIKTPTYPSNGGFNELRLDDSAGAQEFYVRAQRDLFNLVENDRTERVVNNETRVVGQQLAETTGRDQRVSIGGASKTKVKGESQLKVSRDHQDTVDGDEILEIKETTSLKVSGDESEKVGASRTTTCDTNISRTGATTFNKVVNGSYTATASENISTTVNWDYTEEVTGNKTTTAAEGNIQQSIAGPMTTKVTGSVMRSSKQDMSYSAEDSFITVKATADFTSDEKLHIESDGTIQLVASEELKLTVGGVSITLTPGAVRFTGDLRFNTKGKITISGKPDNLTR